MKKKIIILALCTGMLAGTAAQAQMVELVPDKPDVVFKDKIDPNTMGIYFIVKEGGDINNDEDIYALKHATSDAEGMIEFSFVMPDEKFETPLEYDIYIKEDGKKLKNAEEEADIKLVYASVETRKNLLDEINAIQKDGTEVDKIKAILENNKPALEAIGCKYDYADENTAANMVAAIDDFSTITLEKFKDVHNYESVKDNMESSEDKSTYLEVIDPVFEDKRYSDIYDENLKAWLASYPYTEENYKLANILYKFNNGEAEDLEDLFDTYVDDLGITEKEEYEEYTGKTGTKKSKINIKIAEELKDEPARDVDRLLKAVSNALNAKDNDGSNSSSSGGNGGGSFVPTVPSTGGTPSVGIAGFKDLVDAEWARTAVMGLANAGIVSGDENGNFRPNDYVTREEYVKMLVVAANKLNIYATCDFKDVSKDAWYYSYVASAKQFGLTSGINEEEFGTGMALTRQDMAVLSLNAKGDVQKVRDDVTFADSSKIAGYAKDAVSKLYMSGAVNGTGNGKFEPLGKATRAECAQIIYNLFIK